MSFREFIKAFNFSKSEKNGLLVFITILLLLFFIPYIYQAFNKKNSNTKMDIDMEQLIAFEAKLKKSTVQSKLFTFNPNTVDSSKLLQLGFSPKQAKIFLNFRKKGKIFYHKKDVSEVFGISEAFYKKLEPYITIEKKLKIKKRGYKKFNFDPNTINRKDLSKLGFSKKQINTFLNYRRKGGKFYKKEDVKKIYGVSNNMYANLEPYITIKVNPKKKFIPIKLKRFYFDPNKIDSLALSRLGFSPRQTRTFLNYRRKGGKFYKKEDVRKIYGVSSNMYAELEPYIIVNTNTKQNFKHTSNNVTTKTNKKTDLNTATAYSLKKLGIPSKISWTIVNYRNALGGFYSFNQLKEVYDITDENISNIENNMQLFSKNIKKIDLNIATNEELKKHPYFRKKVYQITSFKKQNGRISIPDLKKMFSSEEFNKILHYVAK